jgi:hypothetical protein
VVWDLPEADKRRIREAVLARTSPKPGAGAPAASQAPASEPAQTPENVSRALAAHKALAAQVARLVAKRDEIKRWDEQAQDKFRQAFGSADEALRARVLQRIDQEIQQRTRLMATLADNIRFEFYVARNKSQ